MARKPRIEFAGAVYHVLRRGNHGENIYQDDEDRKGFLGCLGEVRERTGERSMPSFSCPIVTIFYWEHQKQIW